MALRPKKDRATEAVALMARAIKIEAEFNGLLRSVRLRDRARTTPTIDGKFDVLCSALPFLPDKERRRVGLAAAQLYERAGTVRERYESADIELPVALRFDKARPVKGSPFRPRGSPGKLAWVPLVAKARLAGFRWSPDSVRYYIAARMPDLATRGSFLGRLRDVMRIIDRLQPDLSPLVIHAIAAEEEGRREERRTGQRSLQASSHLPFAAAVENAVALMWKRKDPRGEILRAAICVAVSGELSGRRPRRRNPRSAARTARR